MKDTILAQCPECGKPSLVMSAIIHSDNIFRGVDQLVERKVDACVNGPMTCSCGHESTGQAHIDAAHG